MPLSLPTIRRCFELAQHACECQRDDHDHQGRCSRPLKWSQYGHLARGGWYCVAWTPREAGGADEPENGEVLCGSCYEAVMQERQRRRA